MIKTIMNSEETIEVQYSVKDGSFDHEFGTKILKDYQIHSIKIYVDEVSEWISLININSEKLDLYVIDLIDTEESGDEWTIK